MNFQSQYFEIIGDSKSAKIIVSCGFSPKTFLETDIEAHIAQPVLRVKYSEHTQNLAKDVYAIEDPNSKLAAEIKLWRTLSDSMVDYLKSINFSGTLIGKSAGGPVMYLTASKYLDSDKSHTLTCLALQAPAPGLVYSRLKIEKIYLGWQANDARVSFQYSVQTAESLGEVCMVYPGSDHTLVPQFVKDVVQKL
jgi:hypothetical protein